MSARLKAYERGDAKSLDSEAMSRSNIGGTSTTSGSLDPAAPMLPHPTTGTQKARLISC